MASSAGKSLRDLSFKPRFRHNYGDDEKFYDTVVNYKDTWEKCMFYLDEELLKKQVNEGKLFPKNIPDVSSAALNLKDLELETLGQEYVQNHYASEVEFTIASGDKESNNTLEFGKPIELKGVLNRNGLVFFAGGQVTSSKWLHLPLDSQLEVQYLAVSIIHNPNGLKDTINHPELSIFHRKGKENTIYSAIQIWKYNVTTTSLELFKFYDTTSFGATSSLEWLPINVTGDSNVLGALVGNFTDGDVHIFKISADHCQYVKVVAPSLTYSFSTTRTESKEIINITTFEFLGSDKLLVGLTDGCIAEFILPYYSETCEDENELHIPSSVTRIGDSAVSALSVAEPQPNTFLISVATTGVHTLVFEYQNFVQGRVVPLLKTNLKPSYNPSLRMFVLAPSGDSISYSFAKSPHETGNTLLRLDAVITISKLSERLGHPLNLSGTTDGDIIVLNYTRKFLNGSKTTSKVLVPLKLWKLTLANKTLRLSGDYEVIPPEAPAQNSVSPPEVFISTVSWNENLIGSSVYASGSASGLVIVERLDPLYNE